MCTKNFKYRMYDFCSDIYICNVSFVMLSFGNVQLSHFFHCHSKWSVNCAALHQNTVCSDNVKTESYECAAYFWSSKCFLLQVCYIINQSCFCK